MHHQEYPPPHPLTEAVKCFWTSERAFIPPYDAIDVLPDGYVEIVFHYGAVVEIEDEAGVHPMPRYAVVGLLDRPFRLRVTGTLRTVAARLFPWAGYALFGSQVHDAGRVHALGQAWEPIAHQMEQDVAQNDALAAVTVLQTFLLDLAATTFPDTAPPPTYVALMRGDTANIQNLADASHLSRRQLERRFQSTIGVSPKDMVRKVRFQHLRDHLSQNPAADIARLAHDYGYSDQAHLTRDFKQFSGRTPRQFAAEMRVSDDRLRFGVAFPHLSEQ